MNTAKIVIREVHGDGGFQVRQLLAERVCEPRKSSHRHSHSQVLPLHERRRDMLRIRIASSDFGYNPRDAWWGVPRIGSVELPKVAKHFRELREVQCLRHYPISREFRQAAVTRVVLRSSGRWR